MMHFVRMEPLEPRESKPDAMEDSQQMLLNDSSPVSHWVSTRSDSRRETTMSRAKSLRLAVQAIEECQTPQNEGNQCYYPAWVLINPDDSKILNFWDVYIVVLLLIVTITVPFETAFIDREVASVDVLFVFNTFVDFSFFIDLCMQFIIVQKDEHLRPISSPWGIAKQYLKGWFWVDSVSILPIDGYTMLSGQKAVPGLSGLKAIKVVRLLRLVRLIRLAKFQRITSRWHTSVGMSYATISVLRFFVMLLIVCHWMACIWGFTATQQDCDQSWVSSVVSDPDPCLFDPAQVYILSLYWAVMTLTSIGYGDIVPKNDSEYVICTICMMFMAGLWAYVIGAMCTIVATMHPQEIQFRQDMDGLNEFMEDYAMPQSMRKKMRRYFYEAREVHRHRMEKSVMDQLSPALQGEVLLHMHEQWISKIWYFENKDDSFVVGAARLLVLHVFAPAEEVFMVRTLVIVRRGLCARAAQTAPEMELLEEYSSSATNLRRKRRGSRRSLSDDNGSVASHPSFRPDDSADDTAAVTRRKSHETEVGSCVEPLSYLERMWPRIYGDGSYWGEDMLLLNQSLRDEAMGRALTYLDVVTLAATPLITMLPRFPEVHRALCRARCKLAVGRAMKKLSWHIRRFRQNPRRESLFRQLEGREMEIMIQEMLRGDFEQGRLEEVVSKMGTEAEIREARRKVPRRLEVTASETDQQMLGTMGQLLGRIQYMEESQVTVERRQAKIESQLAEILSALQAANATNSKDTSTSTNGQVKEDRTATLPLTGSISRLRSPSAWSPTFARNGQQHRTNG